MNLKQVALGAALLGLTVMPAFAGVDLTVNLAGDDQAHFDFNAGPSSPDDLEGRQTVAKRKAYALASR